MNAAVAYALAEDLPRRLAERANPRGRAWERVRAESGRVARIATVNADGLPPDREQELRSLRQIERFLTWATRIKRPSPRMWNRTTAVASFGGTQKKKSHVLWMCLTM
ncbi:hypothetical protein E1294_08115 [Nonomuraea diastatica]|uniref:Uncharacterized protein n=1 Tax=Nonomuraea diastatica TaxID=1848329 RepID=A0A4R4X0P6_9ACTN|nr:hypothetical protein E1294_08115 [Nonomuraea diastatica]